MPVRLPSPLLRKQLALLRPISRPYSTPPPQSPPKQPSRVGTFYRNNTYPVLKAFLGALFTYQLAYFGWLKLAAVEERFEEGKVVEGLRDEVRTAARKA